MKQKRQKILQLLEYFSPSHCDWEAMSGRPDQFSALKLTGVQEDKDGVSSEAAFFSISEQGKYPTKVNGIPRLMMLLWGQRRMALQIEEWKIGVLEGVLHPAELVEDDEFLKQTIVQMMWSLCKEYHGKWPETKDMGKSNFVLRANSINWFYENREPYMEVCPICESYEQI